MDLEQIDSDAMDQDIHVNISNDENICIHIPNERDMAEMKEEHLDPIQTFQLVSNDEQDCKDVMLEELEITKLNKGKKRVSLTIEKKIEIIQRHEKGETQRALSQEYNVGRTTVSDILKRKYKFFKFMSMNADKEENLKRRRTLRRTVHKVLEDKLLEWYNECRAQGGYVSGPMIAVKAQELHKELGYTDNFTASNGWLDRFKVRNGIKLCGLREVRTESDVNAVAPFKAELESLAQWYNFTLEQVYNADEADLFWKMMPNPESDMNEVKASVRAYRERMTVMCCANAAGTHKLPLVCIGRGKKSRTFTSQEVKTMPVNYFSQETAWMDHDIFREWFHSHFVPSVQQHLRYQGLPETALLLIDRSTSHPSDQYLRSEDGFFFCQYFPAKVKSLIQPMEQGIITNMKRHYRANLLTELIAKNQTISEFQKTLTLKEAIRGIALGWDAISEEFIRQCFSKVFPSAIEDADGSATIADPSITSEAFEMLIRQIPECDEYSRDRMNRWLNCDEAEPQKDCNSFKQSKEALEQSDQEEKIMFIKMTPEDAPDSIEIIASSSLDHQNSTIIEQASDEEFILEEQDELLAQNDTITDSIVQNQTEPLFEYEDDSEVTCKQAVDALNVLIKFMKKDTDSRYLDVVMLVDLKKKLKEKLTDGSHMKEEQEY